MLSLDINLYAPITSLYDHYLGDVYCFDTNCYCLAFGVPAILMVTALSMYFLIMSIKIL